MSPICSEEMRRSTRKPPAFGRARVDLGLANVPPTEYSHQLASRSATLGSSCCRRLSQAMSRQVWDTGFLAALAEPVREAWRCEGPALLGDEKRQVPGGARVNHTLQLGIEGDIDGERLAVTALLHQEAETAISHVLPAKQHDVRPSRTREAKQGKRQSRFRADRVTCFKSIDVGRCPAPGNRRLSWPSEVAPVRRRSPQPRQCRWPTPKRG